MDEKNSWVTSMLSRGYDQGPEFSSYDALLTWDSTNKRPHIRRLFDGEYRVFFTDNQTSPDTTSLGGTIYDIN